jgi:subtilase family serine protease
MSPNILSGAGHGLLRGTTWVYAGRAAPAQPPKTSDCLKQIGIRCYRPGQLQKAYDMRRLYHEGHSGQGQTIVLVDSFGSPTIKRDLRAFDQEFGLPDPPSFRVMRPEGPIPPFRPNGLRVGWAVESSLDVEYAHAMAPQANIVLVETPVAETEGVHGLPEMMRAERTLIRRGIGDVISQSFGATEETFPSERSLMRLRFAFEAARRHHVTVLASSGDFGSTNPRLDGVTFFRRRTVAWPSSDPLVSSIGGTQLHLNNKGRRIAPDNVWNDIPEGIDAAAGGGPSHVFGRPSFQRGIATGADGRRATPDISLSAAVDGGALVLVSFAPFKGGALLIVGGTSESSPLFSGVVAIADQVAGHRLGWINPAMYRLNRGIVDITRGNNTFTLLNSKGKPVFTVPGFAARPGYDMASGLGTPNGFRFAHALAASG